jgi:choline dehydrogenase-like flavoprotein
MICDFNDSSVGEKLTADLCIIGGGAAGITIAREFFGTTVEVLLIEGGGKSYEPESQALYHCEIVGLPHHAGTSGRARVLGGTTTLWAGQALPLSQIDFEARDWVSESGWPITRQALEPFYRRAEAVMQLPEMSYDERSWAKSGVSPPGYDESKLRLTLSQFSPCPNFAKLYHADLRASRNVRVLLHANAVALLPDESVRTIRYVDVKSLGGKRASVVARYYVICCGGIETARLLLSSDQVVSTGIGNAHDLVGRYFQDHIHYTVPVAIEPVHRKLFAAQHSAFRHRGIKYLPKIQSSEQLQRERRILNVVGEIVGNTTPDETAETAKQVASALRRRAWRNALVTAGRAVARDPRRLAVAAYRYFITGEPVAAIGDGALYLGVGCEQQPNPLSRVRLGATRDALGLRHAVIDWRVTGLEKRTIEVFARTVADEFKRLGLGQLDVSDFSLPDDKDLCDCFNDASHHIGTTRMSDEPRRGVVDRQCRVHGIDNLYIGSSAVFPTGGASNPTLTIIALCLRLADALKAKLLPC